MSKELSLSEKKLSLAWEWHAAWKGLSMELEYEMVAVKSFGLTKYGLKPSLLLSSTLSL